MMSTWTKRSIPILLLILLVMLNGCGGGKEYQVNLNRKQQLAQEIESLRTESVVANKVDIIKGYEDFLEHYTKADPLMRAQALERLGDLYLETAHRRFLTDMDAYEILPKGPPPVVDYQMAIQTYRELLGSYPDYRHNDQALYGLARAYAESGERDQMELLLVQLVRDYPESAHRLEAHFRLGEYYFDRRQYQNAAEAYSHALRWKDPFFQDKTQYKLGWTYFNLKAYQKAVDSFLSLVDLKTAKQEEFVPEEGSLVWEALTYVATSFRLIGGPSKLSAYFQERGSRRYEKDLYLMLGNQYRAQENPKLGIETYVTFVAHHPVHPMAPIFSSYVIEVHKKQNDQEAARRSQIALVQNYASTSPWYNVNDEAARLRARPLVKETLKRLALTAHAKAQKGKREKDFREAAEWYDQFLREFPQDKEAPEIHFLFAETLHALKDFPQAAAAYEAVAYNYPTKGVDRKAAYAAIVTYQKVNSPDGEQKVVELSQRFSGTFPEDPQAPIVLMKAGEILFDAARYSDAIGIFENFLILYPTHRSATTARKLAAHSYMRGEHFGDARKAYSRALAALPSSEKKERKDLTELLAAAIYKQAEKNKAENHLEEAALIFAELPKEVPQNKLAPEALFQAGALYEEMKRSDKAIQTYQLLIRHYPKSDLVGKAHIQVALLYEQGGKELQAAKAFYAAAQSPSIEDTDLLPHLLWKAGLYYEKGGKWGESYTALSHFTKRFPKHPDLTHALFKMAQASQKEGKNKRALKLYRKVAEQFPGTDLAAQALFQTAEDAYNKFSAIRLKEPLAKTFKKKTKAMEQVITLYTEVAQTHYTEVVTVSVFRLGEVFEHFKTSLLESDPPKELNAEQKEEYLFQLEEKAYPFEQKAIDAYLSNVQRTQGSDGLYDEWIKKSYLRLAELRPALYRRPERGERVVSDIDPKILTAESDPKTFAKILDIER